jgi:ATP-dependent DNA helicase RecG
VTQSGHYARAVWFNQPYMRQKFQPGQEVLVTGVPRRTGLTWELHHPQVQWLEADLETPRGRLLPVYRLTAGLDQRQLRQVTRAALEQFADALDETFPLDFLETHNLWPIHKAIEHVHFPEDAASLAAARRRFVYQDLFVLQLALAWRKEQQAQPQSAPVLHVTGKVDARIRRLIPFELTAGQERAIAEISADLQRDRPMNRLLQGDVGVGKTIVAFYALLAAVAHGCQGALMAPTELLARQHFESLEKLLVKSQVRRAMLTGATPAAERRDLLARLAAGELDLVVGTQALLGDDVVFKQLGMAVIDEQHRFGVRQRASLKTAGLAPHYLVMTATPIPRTLAMTLFGDLDVSILRDPPPGRQPVHTYLATPAERDKWWEFVAKKLRSGRQAFVIAPLVEEGGDDAASAEELFESLANGPLEAFRLGLVHGRLGADEKLAAMQAFREGKTQVLVATGVVEVGVDVPNATLLTIEDGQRFGLAQLHQLRGRIRRGAYPGFCCVFTADEPQGPARERLDAFVKIDDGFELAELDFKLRGPGNLLGTEQHGLAALRAADLVRDGEILQEARHDAQALIAADPELSDARFARLRAMVLRRYGEKMELGDVG